MNYSRCEFYREFVSNISGEQRKLFAAAKYGSHQYGSFLVLSQKFRKREEIWEGKDRTILVIVDGIINLIAH